MNRRYLAEQTGDLVTSVVVVRVDPDDADETDDVLQFRTNVAWLELGKLLAGLLQHGQVGQVGLGLQRAILVNTYTQMNCDINYF